MTRTRLSSPPGPRGTLVRGKRIVVKIGSSSLAGATSHRLADLARDVAKARANGREVVVVSSGAIALGMQRFKMKQRPKAIAELQACAAAGQSLLMRGYEDAFGAEGIVVSQVLLTHSDLADRDRYLNAQNTLDALFAHGAVPVINENDTVATEEIRFGDNDQLAAMVSTLVGADLLLLLTDVEGVLDASGSRLPIIEGKEVALSHVRGSKSTLGTGGMGSKIEAAFRAAERNVSVVIANAKESQVIVRVTSGEDLGTLFVATGSKLTSRKHWIAHTLRPKGTLTIDDGARRAVVERGRSLLPSGVLGVRGDFVAGDPVSVVDRTGLELARGLVRYGAHDTAKIATLRSEELTTKLGRKDSDELIHRDDLVVLQSKSVTS